MRADTMRFDHAVVRPVAIASLAAAISVSLACAPQPARTGGLGAAQQPDTGLDAALRRYAMYGFSGAVLVDVGGHMVLEAEYGLADRARGIAVSRATAFDVGSITKTFTAAAILALVDDGRLRLTDSVSRFFPEVAARVPGITVHRLLTHTSGLPLDPAHAGIDSTDAAALFVRKALAFDAARDMGRYGYSNLGYGLLALIVERVTGEPFQSFVDRRLIRRSGLRQTIWWAERDAMARRSAAVGYVFSDREEVLEAEPRFGRGAPDSPVWSKWPIGAGGIVSTVGDLRRWWTALHGEAILSHTATAAMFSMQDSAGMQGYGWNIRTREPLGRIVYRGGSRTGFNSMLARYPDRDALVVFTVNQSVESQWPTFLWRRIEQHLAGSPDSLPPPTMALAPDGLRAFAGVFESSDRARVRIEVEGNELMVGAENQAGVDALGCGVPDSVAAFAAQASLRAAPPGTGEPMVLGTTPHPSGPGRVQTFVVVPGRSEVHRFIWQGERLLARSDGVRMPCLARYYATSARSAVAFSPRAAGWAELRIYDAGALQVRTREGKATEFERSR